MRLWRLMMEICNKTCSEKHSIHLKCVIVNCRQYWCTFWRLVWSRDCKWEVLVHLWPVVSVEVADCTFVAYSMTGRVIEYQDTWHPCKVVYWLTWHPLGRGVADRLPRSLLLSGGSLSSLGEGFRGACSLPPLWRHTWLHWSRSEEIWPTTFQRRSN